MATKKTKKAATEAGTSRWTARVGRTAMKVTLDARVAPSAEPDEIIALRQEVEHLRKRNEELNSLMNRQNKLLDSKSKLLDAANLRSEALSSIEPIAVKAQIEHRAAFVRALTEATEKLILAERKIAELESDLTALKSVRVAS